jgi:hypothetical protein
LRRLFRHEPASANRFREDLKQAGLGSGRHSFEFVPLAHPCLGQDEIEVRRSFDGARLELSGRRTAAKYDRNG